MAKYVSGRQKNLKVGISSYSENLTSLEVIGNVGIATTNATSKLYVVGDGYFTGIVTASNFSVGNSLVGAAGSFSQLNVSGITTLGVTSATNLTAQQLNVSGITTLGITSTTNLTSQQLNVSGITTLGVTSATNLTSRQLNVSGITTLGVTSATNLTSQQLNVSGISTLGVVTSGNIYSTGIVTATQFSTGSGTLGFTTNTINGPSEIIIDPSPVGVGTTSGAVRIKGDLYVDGTQFIVNSTTIELADFNVGIATTVGTNALLDGAGIGIGSANIRKTFTYSSSPSDSLKSSENLDIASGKVYKIAGTEVLSSTQLTVANINATGISTLGVTSTTNLTSQQLNVSGISTIQSTTLIGGGTSTGTAGQVLQVAGINSSVYIGGNLGIGTTNSTSKLYVVGDGYFTGVVTATAFYGTFSGNAATATYATSAGIATYATNAGIATYATSAGIATYATNAGIATYATSAGIATYATNAGIATYADNAGISTNVIGGIASVTQLQVTGVSTFTNGPVLVGTTTATGTASQPLQVTGGAYVSGSIGIGTTNPQFKLDVNGDINFNGTFYQNGSQFVASRWASGTGDNIYRLNGNVGVGTTNPTVPLSVIGNANFTGVVTASSFSGNASSSTYADNAGVSTYATSAGIATYATNAGIATNLKGGLVGNIPYQSSAHTTVFLANGTDGHVLRSNGPGATPSWVSAAPSGAITGITIRDEGDLVGVEGSVTQLDFVGSNISVVSTSGIATIAVSNNLVGTALSITGISTFTNGPVLVGTTTATGTASQKLQVDGGAYVSDNLGIGTTNPTSKLYVVGDGYFTGILTANRIISSVYGEFVGGSISGTNIVGTALSITGISTFSNGPVFIGAATSTGTASQRLQVDGGAYVSDNLGIGTTNPTSKLYVVGDGYFTGVVTATSFSGSGTNLTGIVTSIVAGTNITVSAGSTGQVTINAAGGLDILEVMLFA